MSSCNGKTENFYSNVQVCPKQYMCGLKSLRDPKHEELHKNTVITKVIPQILKTFHKVWLFICVKKKNLWSFSPHL